ncbi:uncharacterized protein LOC134851417 [Symsagittifera roscoffensis]|uniref:uncharacterized protein LOC134851417 n=1 Tax=Symsagittifera roscoffensis TaxID=84072 RepID=UPI00307C1220
MATDQVLMSESSSDKMVLEIDIDLSEYGEANVKSTDKEDLVRQLDKHNGEIGNSSIFDNIFPKVVPVFTTDIHYRNSFFHPTLRNFCLSSNGQKTHPETYSAAPEERWAVFPNWDFRSILKLFDPADITEKLLSGITRSNYQLLVDVQRSQAFLVLIVTKSDKAFDFSHFIELHRLLGQVTPFNMITPVILLAMGVNQENIQTLPCEEIVNLQIVSEKDGISRLVPKPHQKSYGDEGFKYLVALLVFLAPRFNSLTLCTKELKPPNPADCDRSFKLNDIEQVSHLMDYYFENLNGPVQSVPRIDDIPGGVLYGHCDEEGNPCIPDGDTYKESAYKDITEKLLSGITRSNYQLLVDVQRSQAFLVLIVTKSDKAFDFSHFIELHRLLGQVTPFNMITPVILLAMGVNQENIQTLPCEEIVNLQIVSEKDGISRLVPKPHQKSYGDEGFKYLVALLVFLAPRFNSLTLCTKELKPPNPADCDRSFKLNDIEQVSHLMDYYFENLNGPVQSVPRIDDIPGGVLYGHCDEEGNPCIPDGDTYKESAYKGELLEFWDECVANIEAAGLFLHSFNGSNSIRVFSNASDTDK